jgi:hypothetical protein
MAVGRAGPHASPRRRDAPGDGHVRRRRPGVATRKRCRASRMDAQDGRLHAAPGLPDTGEALATSTSSAATAAPLGTTAGRQPRWASRCCWPRAWQRTCTRRVRALLKARASCCVPPHHQGDTLALNPDALEVDTEVAFICDHRQQAAPGGAPAGCWASAGHAVPGRRGVQLRATHP